MCIVAVMGEHFERSRAVPVEPQVPEGPRAIDHVVHERHSDVRRPVVQRGEGEVVEIGPFLKGKAPVEGSRVAVPGPFEDAETYDHATE